MGTEFPLESPGRVPRSLDEALRELEECREKNCRAYLVEIVKETGNGDEGEIIECKGVYDDKK